MRWIMYNQFNLYFLLEDDKDLVYFNDINYIEKNNIADKEKIKNFVKDNDQYNIFYISKKKEFENFMWISDDYSADVVILKSSEYSEWKDNKFHNVILKIDSYDNLLEILCELYYSVDGWVDLKFNKLEKDILFPVFNNYAKFIAIEINNGNYTHIKQFNSFFNKEKFDAFGENSAFVSPDLKVYCHPSFYWTDNEEGLYSSLDEFYFSEERIHFSRPHIVCHTCETFYCERNIYNNFMETREFKVPAFSECNKTTFLSEFSKIIFNRIQDKITLNEVEILDRLDTKFNAEMEYHKISKKLTAVNNIKNIEFNYVKDAKEHKDWNSKK